MKKLLLLVLTVSIALLSACSTNATPSDVVKAQDVVTRYMDDTISNSLSGIENYFVVKGKNKKEYNAYATRIREELVSNLKGMSEINQFLDDEMVNRLHDKITTAVMSKIKYKITSADIDEKKKSRVVVKCSVDFPVMGSSSGDSEEYIDMLGDYIDVSDSEKMVQTILERSEMTMEELSEKYATMSQEEITKDMLSYYAEEIDAYLTAIIDKMVEDVDYERIEKVMYMTKQSNNSWKILRVEQ